jgi:hypothetical protein
MNDDEGMAKPSYVIDIPFEDLEVVKRREAEEERRK